MHRVRLGKSGLMVSPICHGCWQLAANYWGKRPKDMMIKALRHAFEVGVNFYDTADEYGNGYSEQVVGEALKDLPRDQIVVATKVYYHFYPDGRIHGDLSRDYVLAECEASLKRLGMDYIDLYQCHSFDPMTPLEETTEALEKLKDCGKIRNYGVSNFTVDQLRLAKSLGNYATLQPRYNLLECQIERDLLPYCHRHDIGVLVYSPLYHGLLTGRYDGSETFTTGLRGRNPNFQGERFKDLAGRVRALAPIAEKYSMSIVQLVLAVTLMNPMIDCAIVGISKPEQIEQAAAVMGKSIGREDYFKVRSMVGQL